MPKRRSPFESDDRGRQVVNLVCLQTTRQEGIGDHALDALRRMCEAAAAGYRRVIRGRQARLGA